MAQKVYAGVLDHQEVNVSHRRDDPRSVWRKLSDALETPTGTVKFFGALTGIVALPMAYIPGSGEVGVLVATSVLLGKYLYGNRKWEAPFRVPAFAAKKLGMQDGSTGRKGQGTIYLGREINSNRQVWASANDVKTHRLVVGTTGSGKTEEILGNIFNALVLDSGAMLVDGKSDPKTFNSLLAVCRVLGRDEDLLLLNYIMGGKDFADGMDSRRSHTYNPLGSGSAAMKSELMVSLLDSGGGGNSDMWQGRAINFLEAICPPLSYLADRGLLLFNPKLLCDYYLLENIENLLWFGIFVDMNGVVVDLKNGTDDQKRLYNTMFTKYCGNLRLYVENLPGYSAVKPKKPNQPSTCSPEEWNSRLSGLEARRKELDLDNPDNFRAYMDGDGDGGKQDAKKKQSLEQTRGKVLEQHGFITMQLVRATGNLTFNYGHIYNDEIGEINYRDALLNRRILLVMLPALERSKQSMEQLGKMAVSAIKGVLATLLDTPLEGKRREIIDGRPSNAEVPYSITCDEYGYYVVPGFAVAPAQARSYGVSITFGAQDYPSLTKGNKEEGEATWENTNLRLCGRMTGGEESETYKKIAGAGGKAAVSVAQDMDFSGSPFDNFQLGMGSRLEMVNRINADDLNQQENGEFHLIVGKKSEMTGSLSKKGGSKVVRLLSFYTGNIPQPTELALVHYVQVKAFSDREREVVLQNEAVASALALLSPEKVEQDLIGETDRAALDDIFQQFCEWAGTQFWEINDAEIAAWLDQVDSRREEERRQAEAQEQRNAAIRHILDGIGVAARQAFRDEKTVEDHLRLAGSVLSGWQQKAQFVSEDHQLELSVAEIAQKRLASAHALMS